MSKTRKILSIVLALAMIVSTFAVSAFAGAAYESEEDAGNYNQTWALSVEDNGDDTHTVSVSLTTDYATGPIEFVLTNTDPAAVTYVPDSVEVGEDYPYAAYASAYADEEDGSVVVMIVPNTSDVEGTFLEAVEVDGVVAKVTYTLVSGSADIVLENDPATATNPNGSLIAARAEDGNILSSTMVAGQTVAITEGMESVTIGNTVLPSDLAKTAGAEAGVIIDTTKKFNSTYDGVVYGFTQVNNATFASTAYLTKNLEATNGGSLSFVNNVGSRGYSTGTEITVTGLDGGVKKYVVVIFGDVNSDCMINSNDLKAIQTAISVSTTYANNSVQRMAANCQNIAAPNLMTMINSNDLKAVQSHLTGTKIDQAALASRLAGLTTIYK